MRETFPVKVEDHLQAVKVALAKEHEIKRLKKWPMPKVSISNTEVGRKMADSAEFARYGMKLSKRYLDCILRKEVIIYATPMTSKPRRKLVTA